MTDVAEAATIEAVPAVDQGADEAVTTDTAVPVIADPTDAEAAAGDWRSRRATDGEAVDDKLLKYLGRYHSEAAYDKASKQIHDDIRAGKYIKPLGADASDEDKAAWAKAMGVPDKPEGYLEALPKGLVVGDDDKPAVDEFVKAMHEAGSPKGAVDAALQTYYKLIEDQETAEIDRMEAAKESGTEALREEWGTDYKRNINVVNSLLATMPEQVSAAFSGGTDAEGVPLASNPEVIKWLAGIALEQNPHSTIVPGAGANQASSVADEIGKIETTIRNDRRAYNRDEGMQARYRDLLDAQAKLAKS